MIKISAVANAFSNVWPYIIAILVFLLIIVIHEFGHFLMAKILGVRVNEFAVGFGPKIFSKKIGDTAYSLNLIPLGGYCAMEGENEHSFDSKAFCNRSAWRRFLIVVMGAVFNLLLGFILIAVTLAPEKRFTSTVIAQFSDNSVSQNYGLKVNDKIVEIDSRKIFTTYDLSYAFTNVDDGTVDITVIRDGKRVRLKNVKFNTETEQNISYITVDFYVYGIRKTVGNYIKHTFNTSCSYCLVIWRSLIDLVTGKYGISAVSGPIGVTAAMGGVAKQSIFDLLPIMALITINLGIFNLLPLPALDGGRLLFILIEMIVRKPVPQKYEATVHAVGFALLLGFMLLVTAKDIWWLFMK